MWTYIVEKRHKRLQIIEMETDKLVYSPPNFIRLHSREPLQRLAARFTELGRRDIGAIMAFEAAASNTRSAF